MTYTKLPDEFPEQPEIANLSDPAYRLHVNGLIYANRRLTDGVVPRGVVRTLVPRFRKAALDELVAARIWIATKDGYTIPSFTDHQLTREQVERLRADRVRAGRLGGAASGAARREAPGEAPASANGQATPRAKPNPVPTPRTPYPSRSVDRPDYGAGAREDDDRHRDLGVRRREGLRPIGATAEAWAASVSEGTP
jgi:hypothetical protein